MSLTDIRKAAATSYVQDYGTNVLHLGYTDESGSLKAACNTRFQVYEVAKVGHDSQFASPAYQADMGCMRCFA